MGIPGLTLLRRHCSSKPPYPPSAEARGFREAARIQKLPSRRESLGPEAERANQPPHGIPDGGVVITIVMRRLSAALSLPFMQPQRNTQGGRKSTGPWTELRF